MYNCELSIRTNHLTDCNFIQCTLYFNCYWLNPCQLFSCVALWPLHNKPIRVWLSVCLKLAHGLNTRQAIGKLHSQKSRSQSCNASAAKTTTTRQWMILSTRNIVRISSESDVQQCGPLTTTNQMHRKWKYGGNAEAGIRLATGNSIQSSGYY